MATDRRGLRATTLVPHNPQMQLAGGAAAGRFVRPESSP
jgi:hypothetical protein